MLFTPFNPRVPKTTDMKSIAGKIQSEIMSKGWFKPTMLYLVGVMLVFALIGFGASYFSEQAPFWVYVGACVVFLLVGFIHISLLYGVLEWLDRETFWKGFLITIFYWLAGILAIYLIKKVPYIRTDPRTFFSATIWVLIPYTLGWSYIFWKDIPYKLYKAWYYPLNQPEPDTDLIDLSQILVIQFEFPKVSGDTRYTNFTAKAPVNMSLGQLFFVFVNEYNYRNKDKPLQYLDDFGSPHGWVFHRKVSWWKKKNFFDPDLTFRENFVLNNDVIVATRTHTVQ